MKIIKTYVSGYSVGDVFLESLSHLPVSSFLKQKASHGKCNAFYSLSICDRWTYYVMESGKVKESRKKHNPAAFTNSEIVLAKN
ncbi:hypothetical protein [Sutcliffiella horikoshii]|uniref:hypothetical protein n=1 Tax=Sutcliffiella horikoshii TaxID=79883 RepID=UPI001CFE03EB|nr:hypothetical protein [Sutcliffiella horikoshii]